MRLLFLKKRLAVAFTGPSNSGKTTLILKVARKLIHEHALAVAIIKNDPKDKAQFDVPGKPPLPEQPIFLSATKSSMNWLLFSANLTFYWLRGWKISPGRESVFSVVRSIPTISRIWTHWRSMRVSIPRTTASPTESIFSISTTPIKWSSGF